MKPIKAVKSFTLKGVYYDKNDEVVVNTKEELIKLNELGYIQPLTIKEIQSFGKKNIKVEKEEELNGL